MKFVKSRFIRILFVLSLLVLAAMASFFFIYSNSLRGVNKQAKVYYQQLMAELEKRSYKPRIIVISSKRASWHNKILTSFGAAKNSQHLHGNAIDIMVLDTNNDGEANGKDVDIVVSILEEIIGDKGGIGTYKTESLIWNKQMVHLDCRGYRARWKR